MKRQLFAAASLLLMINASAQVTPWELPGNTGTDPLNHFVGTTDNEELVLRTDDLFRFRLNKTETYGSLGGFTSIPANGFGLITPSSSFIGNGPGPFSLFHLADGTGDNVQSLGYRPWMRVGLSVTGNGDQGYLGHKYTYEDPLDHESGEVEDFTDMVIQWSDNPGKWLKDRMRFIFTSAYDESNTGAGSLEGLEAIRLWPKDDSEVNVGFGDFHAGNFVYPTNVVEPTERLDVLNGRVRIRQLPDDDACEENYLVMVVDASSDPGERGVVKWVDPADLPGTTDCDWTTQNQGVSGGGTPHHVITGVGSDALCPDANDAVAIGFDATVVNPVAKLEVKTDVFDVGARIENETASTTNTALYLNSTGGTQDTYGAYITTQQLEGNNHGAFVQADGAGGGGSNIGMEIRAIVPGTTATADNSGLWSTVEDNGSNAVNVGARFDVNGTGSGAANTGLGVNVVSNGSSSTATGLSAFVDGGAGGDALYGLFSKVQGNSSSAWSYGLRTENLVNGLVNYGILAIADNGIENYGIWAKAPTTCTNCWAVFAEGKQFSTTAGTWTTSDQNFKEDIGDLDGGLARILQLQPKTYRFRTEEFDFLNFAQGPQYGLLSQDVESVIPEAVQMVHRPADMDEEGNVQHPEMEIKALNYEMLIPILIAAVKEQNATITMLQEQAAAEQPQSDAIASMQQQLTTMQQQLAACCANPSSDQRLAPATGNAAPDELLLGQERLLRIAPNPFTDRTTLYYTTERSGRVQLMANSADGRDLRILSEAQREAGAYQFEWSTEYLAPGVYYVTLLLDGEPLVKRAVKVGK